MTEDLGTPTRPHALTGEQWRLEVRTDDPPSPSADERWIRSDLDGGDRVATLKCGDGTEIPLFPTGTAEETVREARRYRVGGQTVYAPLAPVDEAAFPARRFQHDGQTHAFHDRVAPGSATPESRVTRYAFEDNLIDSWGDNDGTLVSGSYTTNSAYGAYALSLNGSSDYAEISLPDIWTSGFTVSAWVDFDSINTGTRQVIVSMRGTRDLEFAELGDGTVSLRVYDGGSVNTAPVSASNSGYRHYVGVFDGSSIITYVNGDYGTETPSSEPIGSSDNDAIGQRGVPNDDRWLAGDVDDVRIYDKALSDNEVSDLYNNGSI